MITLRKASDLVECRYLLALLDDDELRSIALWKMEGYTNAEIAEKLGYVNTPEPERSVLLLRHCAIGP